MKVQKIVPLGRLWHQGSLVARGIVLFLMSCLVPYSMVHADVGSGFQVSRYEPTPVGEWSFAVDHPWYSESFLPRKRYFSGGITLDYAHNPLVFGTTDADGHFVPKANVIEHLLMGHADLGISFVDRINISFSLPITLLERGSTADAIAAGVTLTDTAAVGDPRLSLMVRLFGNPYQDAISISIGAHVWFPIANYAGSFSVQERESGWRVMPQLTLSGLKHHVMWSIVGKFLYRPDSSIGNDTLANNRSGMEVQAGFALAYADLDRRFSIGGEITASTLVSNNEPSAADAALGIEGGPFKPGSSSVELLPLAIYYNIGHQVNLGVAGGFGILRQPGTPDGRAILRLAYAPMAKPIRSDRDKDGVFDDEDVCPDVHQGPNPDPLRRGCPRSDRDHDSIWDKDDACPDDAGPANVDPNKHGCPDRDKDGFIDKDDKCPDVPAGPNPDPDRPGCPLSDRDKDGVWDKDDKCPDVAGPKENEGCPYADRDGDGTVDKDDKCPDVPGPVENQGCPLDTDKDGIPDVDDKCPYEPGPADHEGCPPPKKFIKVTDKKIELLQEILFATNKSTIRPTSFALLSEIAAVLKSRPSMKVRIGGHTDETGKLAWNMTLSQMRADSVMKYLIEKEGVDPSHFTEAKGFGPTVDSQKAAKLKETLETASASKRKGIIKKINDANRRTEFVVEEQ